MKFQASVLALLAFGFGEVTASDQSGEECTHGKLFLMDNTTSKVYVIDVHAGVQANMAIETEIAMPSEGAGNLTVYGNPADPLVIQYRGEEPDFDGFVRVVDTGFSFDDHGDHGHVQYEEPSIVSNALIDDCHRPIHEVRHDEKIAIFCDGAFDADPPQNTTIHVVDKTLIGSTTESAVAYSTTLQVSVSCLRHENLVSFWQIFSHPECRPMSILGSPPRRCCTRGRWAFAAFSGLPCAHLA
jgi:hypothetical protein